MNFSRFLESEKLAKPEEFVNAGASYSKYLKRQWVNGFLVGLQEAFDKRKADSTFELMLVTPTAVVERYESIPLRSSNLHVRHERNDYNAFSNGLETGREALNNRSLENTKIGD